jgi:hypothetical protein
MLQVTINGKYFLMSVTAIHNLNTVLADTQHVTPATQEYNRTTEEYEYKAKPNGPRLITVQNSTGWK